MQTADNPLHALATSVVCSAAPTNHIEYDLTSNAHRKLLAARIQGEIDEWCSVAYDEGFRNHLGASVIGHECLRYLFLSFRWCKREKFSGRMQRLFQRGHLEEDRFITYLKGIGFTVKALEEDGKQQRISAVNGHYGGSLDGICIPPERYGLPELVLLNEFKTNKDSGFDKIKKNGMQIEKRRHYIQMCSYGKARQLKYGLYIITNKNNDDIYMEIVALDWNLAEQAEIKATGIIHAGEPPKRISDNPAFMTCKQCHFSGICFNNEVPLKNCRSCTHAIAVVNAEWRCMIYKQNIPKDFIPKGCDSYERII